MEFKTTLGRLLCSVLAMSTLLIGCASQPEPPQPQVQLQDPDKTPREKWSEAMKILRDDMGIKGQMDVPFDVAKQYGLVETSHGRKTRGNSGGLDNLVTGMSSSGATMGVGLFLFLTPTGEVTGPWQQNQAVAWVPAEKAKNIEDAIDVATNVWNDTRKRIYSNPSNIKVKPSLVADFSANQYDGLKNMILKKPISPSSNKLIKPNYIGHGSYYGPIFLSGFHLQSTSDALKNDLEKDVSLKLLSSNLPEWFIIYNSGLLNAGNMARAFPPSVLITGRENFFIGK